MSSKLRIHIPAKRSAQRPFRRFWPPRPGSAFCAIKRHEGAFCASFYRLVSLCLGPVDNFWTVSTRVLLGNLRVSGHKKRPGSCGLQLFSILLYSVRYRLPLIVRVIMMFLFQKPGARQGKWGKGKEAGTRVLAVFLQHICSEVNTTKGVVEALRGCYELQPGNGSMRV